MLIRNMHSIDLKVSLVINIIFIIGELYKNINDLLRF